MSVKKFEMRGVGMIDGIGCLGEDYLVPRSVESTALRGI